jgi:4-hydroxy-3-polyprenylbenzoate decarboxylase
MVKRMLYRNLQECVIDLERHGHLIRCAEPLDARLELAEIQRRLYRNQGPAVLFTHVKNCQFPMLANLFGTMRRAEFLFRGTLEAVRRAIELKIDPQRGLKQPWRYLSSPLTAYRMRPNYVRSGPILQRTIRSSELPQLVSWPDDGGAFITLPQVYTEDPHHAGWQHSNLGMYRIQISGNHYEADHEMGLHYQLHRGIGVHHRAALERNEPLKVNVFVGGHPAMTLSAVMPLPEGMSELGFAGALAGHRIPLIAQPTGLPLYAEADFCISGTVDLQTMKPEGPFGDHLGYYSLQHPFPVLKVEKVRARRDAIWPFTVVGRPPQEDTTFGELIHAITGPIIPTVLPGVKEVHAVDAAGVHPLLLAIGSERYMPFMQSAEPQELLTQACAILGQGQMSLAKFLLIVNRFDAPQLAAHNIREFFEHWLRRIDWRRDLHFHTRTTIDTLDYSGRGLNCGSKVIMAAAGPTIRELATSLPSNFTLPSGFNSPAIAMPGVLAVQAPRYTLESGRFHAEQFCREMRGEQLAGLPLVLLVDDAGFVARSLNNLLWVTFTRSDPATDLHGLESFIEDKHWGCHGSLVIDARMKPHHAPPLVEDPEVTKKIDALAARGGSLAEWL